MTKGYLRLPQAFPKEKAAEWTKDVWVRLGMDPDDRTTWTREWTNMPRMSFLLSTREGFKVVCVGRSQDGRCGEFCSEGLGCYLRIGGES